MEPDEFQRMWQRMQREGYFRNHPHYSDHFGATPTETELALDRAILALDFSQDEICMPEPYSDRLERSVKRTEADWLYRMFELPDTGVALDLGCGFGRSVAWLCQRYRQVYACDISAEIIDFAREHIQADNVSFLVNSADALPPEIPAGSIDVAYVFTVFQHIPRAHAANLLSQLTELLCPDAVVVFNLLSNVNEAVDDGDPDTEWAIGYSREQAQALLAQAGLKSNRMVRWYRPETAISWLWVAASPES